MRLFLETLGEIHKTHAYLIINLEKNNLKIRQFSNNCPEFFHYTKEQFSALSSIDCLIPFPVNQFHNDLVINFFE